MRFKERVAFFDTLKAVYPEPQTELFYTNAYTLLVAVVLSAQATDKGVNKVTPNLFKVVDTPSKMVALGLEGLKQHVSSIGLYPTKSKHIIALSRRLLDRYQGSVPSVRAELETLPGVGRKTANVVLNVFFKQPTIPVDTHVFRVSNRTALASGDTPLAVEKKLLERVPKAFLKEAHHLLILHGRYICQARRPQCTQCRVQAYCAFFKRNAS